jgi:hypothetical protein
MLKEKTTKVYFEKPHKSLTILKIIPLILSFPKDSPLVPLLWQIFFSLYFERCRTPGVYMHRCFGYLFLKDYKDLQNSVEKFLADLISNLDISEEFRMFYKALYMWIMSPKYIRSDVNDVGEEFYPVLLNSCLTGELFEMGSQVWWIGIIHTEDLELHWETHPEPRIEREEILESCKNLPVLELLDPLVSKFTNLVHAQKVLEQELKVLKGQGRYHSAFVKEHTEQDILYLKEIRKLYTTVQTKQQVFKKCGTQCPGISIEFQKYESVIDNTVSLKLSKITSLINDFLTTEYVDQRTVLAYLRILEIIEFIKSQNLKKVGLKFFYECVELLNIKLNAFPPADVVLNVVMQEFGSFVENDEDVVRVYEMIKRKENIGILGGLFDPLSYPEKFIPFYKNLVEVLGGDDAKLVYERFDIKEWAKKTNPTHDVYCDFLNSVVYALIYNAEDLVTCESHCVIFRNLVRTGPETILPSTISKLILSLSNSDISNTILRDFISSFMTVDFESDFKNGWFNTILTQISKETILEVLKSIQKSFESCIQLDPQTFFKLLAYNGVQFREIIIVLFSASSLYTHSDFVFLEENWIVMVSIFNVIFGISQIPIDPDSFLSSNEIDDYLTLEVFLVEKQCRLFKRFTKLIRSELIPSYIWRILKERIPAKNTAVLELLYPLILTKTWSEFEFDSNVATFVLDWLHQGLFTTISAEFLTNILTKVKLEKCAPALLYNLMIKLISSLDDLSIDRFAFFNFALKLVQQPISKEEYQWILEQIPRTWYSNIETIKVTPDSFTPLSALLVFVKKLSADDKIENYIDFVGSLLNMQSNQEHINDPLKSQSEAFQESKISIILSEILSDIENSNKESLGYCLKTFMIIFNVTGKQGKIFNQLYNGFAESTKITDFPLLYVSQACFWLASAEKIALISELGIAKYLKTSGTKQWSIICMSLHVPELEESLFIRHCLSHCLIYTLYAHALIRLNDSSNEDLKIVIGEQIGVWIESLKWEAIDVGQESKIILILLLFAKLLKYEIDSDPRSFSGRLEAHLPPIADSLYRWSEKASGTSLWTTFGFGQTSILSPQIRLFCRFTSTFIASRLVQKIDLKTQTSLLERIKNLEGDQEFTQWKVFIGVDLVPVFENEEKKIVDLYDVIMMQANVLFPEQVKYLD